ncbi:MAG: sulfate adenylyltransferase [Patescibacteria group bacterium]
MIPLPHGGKLVERRLAGAAAAGVRQRAADLPWLILDQVSLSDLEMLAMGAFSPLCGFMGAADYERVLAEMHLAGGQLWPIPITLPVPAAQAECWEPGQEVILKDGCGRTRGVIRVEEVYPWSPEREARAVFGTSAKEHPGVRRLFSLADRLVGGEIRAFPKNSGGPWDRYVLAPAETRMEFALRGWQTVAGFQTRNPIHRAHEYLQKIALEITDGLFVHPLIGATKEDDVPADLRLQCYAAVLETYFPSERVFMAGMPAAMRYAGPREAILHALVRKNYGCTHFIVGRDHAGVGEFYRPFAAQEIFGYLNPDELGITPLFFDQAFYCRTCANMATKKTCPHSPDRHLTLSGTALRAMLARGETPPPEFTRPEVAAILLRHYSQAGSRTEGN